jgi:ATP-binding cassette subfamily B protein/subfamily B ATP-binding cassette protein MsbA
MIAKLKYRIKMLNELNTFTKGVRKHFIFIFISSIIAMVIDILTPQIYKIFIDNIIIDGKLEYFLIVISGYLCFYFINLGIAYINNYSSNKLVNRTLFRLRRRIWNGYLKMDFTEYERKSIGDMKMKIDDDTNHIADFASYQTTNYVISAVISIVAIIMLFTIEWRLAIFSLISIPITIYIDHIISKKEKMIFYGNRDNDQETYNWLYSCIQGWKESKALNLENKQKMIFVSYLHKFALFFARWINYWVLRYFIVPKIRDEFLFRFCLYFFGGLIIINGDITIGALLVFVQYFGILYKNINNISTTDSDLQSNQVYYDKLLEELTRNNEKDIKKIIPQKKSNEFVFKEVTFKYEGADKNLLKNVDFSIAKGERVAITGKSGEGKTTILKLMTGMLKPNSGNTYFCDVDIKDINPNFLYNKIGIVMQENNLFNMTIMENLLFGKATASEEEIIDACKKACIYDFIQTLPEKFNTIIGERGVNLSGGQRQRIVLARLFLRDADILILDEATSAVDQYSENLIHEAIDNISKDKTVVIVSHRLSSISLCNKIILLQDGSITNEVKKEKAV